MSDFDVLDRTHEVHGLTWETAEALAMAAGWERAEIRKVDVTHQYVRLYIGDCAWEAFVNFPRGDTAAGVLYSMLKSDADKGGRVKRLMTADSKEKT